MNKNYTRIVGQRKYLLFTLKMRKNDFYKNKEKRMS